MLDAIGFKNKEDCPRITRITRMKIYPRDPRDPRAISPISHAVKLDANSATVRGDATAAYEPDLGLTQFTRTFTFTKSNGFTIRDELAAKQPSIFTTLLHADEKIESAGKNQFEINAAKANLHITITAPEDFKAEIEPNILTAPGQPGSVDKGERQQRGERLAVSNVKPAMSVKFVQLLKSEEKK